MLLAARSASRFVGAEPATATLFRICLASSEAGKVAGASWTHMQRHKGLISRAQRTPGDFSAAARFSTSAAQRTSTGVTTGFRESKKDPEPQTGLFYHSTQLSISHGTDQPVETVEAWAISFLSEAPRSDDAIIGYILPPSVSSSDSEIVGQLSTADPAEFVRTNPDRIRINAKGWQVMHDVLKTEVVPNDDLLKFEADTRRSGWAHLTDLRHPLMPGRIATPESIIASVAFVDGELDIESYQINDSYRLVTGYEGPIQMAESWIQKIRQRFQSLSH